MVATCSKTSSDSKHGNFEDGDVEMPLKLVKELLKQQESTLKVFLSAYMNSVNTRIDILIKDVQSVKSSLEFTLEDLGNKLDDLENRSRLNNLCFEGIPESLNETWQESESKIKHLISSHMPEVGTDFVIERAHRVGTPRSDSKPRKILVQFLNYKDRKTVFKAKKKLHGTNMCVNKDYSDHVIKKRTELMPKLKEARRKNQRAFLRFDKLVIYDNPVNSGSTNGEKVPGESSNAD
ncbi:protein unc-13 homolog C-like [Montipora capricornis]|uniref:protein unc-13 homolog C-like n=1 Tax=Montipora capricornis TaxID=246305 RepID=UPI0035F13B1D